MWLWSRKKKERRIWVAFELFGRAYRGYYVKHAEGFSNERGRIIVITTCGQLRTVALADVQHLEVA